MNYEKKNLLDLYRQYTQQIKKDKQLRENIARRMQKFAPLRYGDKVKYKSPFISETFDRFGKVVSCWYEGRWEVTVMPTTKMFQEHRSHKGYEFLPLKDVRKYKEVSNERT